MAVLFDDAGPEYYTADSPISAIPATLACWFRSDTSTPTNQTLLSIGDPTISTAVHALRIRDPAEQDIIALSWDGTTQGFSGGGTSWATDTWTHAAGVFASTTSRTAYINGSASTTNTTSVTPASVTKFTLGFQAQLTSNFPLSGVLADVGLWNVALTTSEIASLAAGASPLMIRPSALKAYYPLWTTAYAKGYFGQLLTATGTPEDYAHPRAIYPPNVIPVEFAAAAASGVAPRAWHHLRNLHAA